MEEISTTNVEGLGEEVAEVAAEVELNTVR